MSLSSSIFSALSNFKLHRKIKLSLAVILTSLSEVLIILGVSAFLGRTLDLPAIAGIIAAIVIGSLILAVILGVTSDTPDVSEEKDPYQNLALYITARISRRNRIMAAG